MIDDGGVRGCRGSGLLMWVHGGDSGGGGQRAVGMVVSGLFGYFLMGLWLVCGWIFARFVVGLVSWWLLCGGDWVTIWRWCG